LKRLELLELLLQLLQGAFLLGDFGFAVLDGFLQFFTLGHDRSFLFLDCCSGPGKQG
jgi:hypothetical protein